MDHQERSRWSRRRFLGVLGGATALSAAPGWAAVGTGSRPSAPGVRLARVRAATPSEAARLAGFDLTHARHGDELDVLLWPGDLDRLRDTGLPFRFVTSAMQADPVEYRRPEAYDDAIAFFDGYFPELARAIALPYPTLEGRTVRAIEIAHEVRSFDGRPTFYMDGLHHAREWPSAEHCLRFVEELVARRHQPRIARLLERVRVLVVPVVNPDGFHTSYYSKVELPPLAVVAGGQDRYWRKNRRSLHDDLGRGDGTAEATTYGVDVNRNYPLFWGGDGASELPADQDYRGGHAASEPETRNIQWLLHRRHVTALLTNHTYGDLVLRPWGHVPDPAPDEALLRSIADRFATLNGYSSIKGIDLYPTTGTTDDWAYGTLGVLGFTIEHGDVFHPPYAVVREQYERNREVFLQAAELAGDPRRHGVIRAEVVDGRGRPLPARVVVERSHPTPTEAMLFAGITAQPGVVPERQRVRSEFGDGVVEVHVAPSTRPVARMAGSGPERYRVTIGSPGWVSTRRKALVRRGDTVDLGRVVLHRLP